MVLTTELEIEVNPIDFAIKLGNEYAKLVEQSDKKEKGQFFTPKEIAQFMAAQFTLPKTNIIRILDPGCGTAILTIALLEKILSGTEKPNLIEVVLYETDPYLIGLLEKIIKKIKSYYHQCTLNITLHISDFILSNKKYLSQETSLQLYQYDDKFDYIISNPPYFKLGKEDERSVSAQRVLTGQLNIYAVFMALSAKMLQTKGEMVFITPRSYAAGKYFESFRNLLFKEVNLTFAHLFSSRYDTFGQDKVLQETLIIKGKKIEGSTDKQGIIISTSNGIKDLNNPKQKYYETNDLINLKSREKIFHIPVSSIEDEVISLFKTWNQTMQDYGFYISTGPVVAHRLMDSIVQSNDMSCSPLIWMHHVNKMNFDFSIDKINKNKFIINNSKSKAYLVENKNYVLLRRFSAKEDKYRLISTPYLKDLDDCQFIGIENKLNYLYKPKGELTKIEALGLSTLLNSSIFEIYFRTFNGNTNVSASELRIMTFPPYDQILNIGKLVSDLKEINMTEIDKIIEDVLGIKLAY